MYNENRKKEFQIRFNFENYIKSQLERAFTLVELLVVISIIALLLSILMPSLAKVRELGRAVVCGTNQHQIYLALSMYTTDNKDKLPPYSYATSATSYYKSPFWHETIVPYFGKQNGQVGDVGGYLSCPSRKKNQRYTQSYGVSYPTIFAFEMEKGYSIPQGGNATHIFNGSAKLSRIPSNVWMISDAKTAYYASKSCQIYNPVCQNQYLTADTDGDRIPDTSGPMAKSYPYTGVNYNGIDPIHPNKSANMVFADGSVSRIDILDWIQNKGGMWGVESPALSSYK